MIQDPNAEILIKRHLKPLQKQISMLQIELDEIKIVLNKQKNIVNKTELKNFIEDAIKDNSAVIHYSHKSNGFELSDIELSDVAEIIANKITENN